MQSPEETQSTTTDQLEKPETEGRPDVEAQPTEPPQGIMAGVPGVQTFTINGS
jgi:hypothetical protein